MEGFNPFSLDGRTILVTGASSGIGRTTAIECSRMGSRMIITGRDTERLDEVLHELQGEGHQSIIADLTQADQVENLLSQLPVVDGHVRKLADGSSVVFVSSIGGVDSITIGNSIYGASKAALNSAMRFCALELAPKQIRVNSVCPGMVNTRLIQGGAVSEEQHQADMQKYPLKRYGEPEDIAHGIVYLLSNASSWVTGHSLVIDGGYTV